MRHLLAVLLALLAFVGGDGAPGGTVYLDDQEEARRPLSVPYVPARDRGTGSSDSSDSAVPTQGSEQ